MISTVIGGKHIIKGQRLVNFKASRAVFVVIDVFKVDQGKLVIRDYSQHTQQKPPCNCQDQNCEEATGQEAQTSIKPGYVENLAKIWDSRIHNQGSIHSPPDIRGLNTVV